MEHGMATSATDVINAVAAQRLRHSQSVAAPGMPSNAGDAPAATGTRRRHTSKHQRFKSADLSGIRFDQIAPDLSEYINTDFSARPELTRMRSDTASSVHDDVTTPSVSAGGRFMQRSALSSSVGDVQQLLSSSVQQQQNVQQSNVHAQQQQQETLCPESNQAQDVVSCTPQQLRHSDVPHNSPGAYDFAPFIGDIYREHETLNTNNKRARGRPTQHQLDDSLSGGSPGADSGLELRDAVMSQLEEAATSVWCLACQCDVIVAGCGNGVLEFWDGVTGELTFQFCHNSVGVTHVVLQNRR